jgi:hypothetical protein
LLLSQEGTSLGFASIASFKLSIELRDSLRKVETGIPVEVKWNDDFNKYQIVRVMPDNTPITTNSFFYHKK